MRDVSLMWGFSTGVFSGVIVWLISTIIMGLIGGPLGAFANAVLLAPFWFAAVLIVGLIIGLICVGALYWSDVDVSFVSSDDLYMWDVFAYARGMTQWGTALGVLGASNPQHFNEDLARETKLKD